MDIEKYEFSDEHLFKGHFNTVEFIKEYERYPCLWNKFHPYFKNRIERDKAEAQLMVKFGFTSNISLRRKIRSIRGTYNTEIRRMKRENNEYEPRLSWFPQADKFLRPMIEDALHPNIVIISPDELGDEIEDGEFIYVGRGDTDETISIESEGKHVEKPDLKETENQLLNKSVNDFKHFRKEKGKHFKDSMKAYRNILRKSKLTQENRMRKCMKSANRIIPTIVEQRPTFTESECVIENNVKNVGKTSNINSCDIFSNEFIAFGTSIALQLQQMPLDIAIETQSAIQTLISNARLRYLRMNKETHKSASELSSMNKSSLYEGENCETSESCINETSVSNFEEVCVKAHVSLLE